MECILKILRLYLFRMNCDILLVFAFGFIRECHFKASSIKQRTQIPIGKILCVFITTIFCDFCFRMRSHAKRKNFIMGCIMGCVIGLIMGRFYDRRTMMVIYIFQDDSEICCR